MRLDNIFRLGVKELWSLFRDPMMLALIFFSSSGLLLHKIKPPRGPRNDLWVVLVTTSAIGTGLG